MVLVGPHRQDHDLAEQPAERNQVLIGDVRLSVDHHTVLLERGQAVVSDAAVDQPAPGKAGDLDADVR